MARRIAPIVALDCTRGVMGFSPENARRSDALMRRDGFASDAHPTDLGYLILSFVRPEASRPTSLIEQEPG